MKKIGVLCLSLLLILCGCGKVDQKSVVDNFKNDVEKTKSYKIKGTMEILSDEDTFSYSLEATYLKDDFYKVILVNQTNNHEQVILKNNDGVYVVTPSLNKSFKFQSDWPFNSSQSYLLAPLLKDIQKESSTMETTENNYIIKTTVDYPNNGDLKTQKIYFDKNMNLEKVEVFNASEQARIKVNFTSVDLKAGLTENDFALEELVDTTTPNQNTTNDSTNNTDTKEETNKSNCEGTNCTTNDKTEKTGKFEEIIYPLYMPNNTYLSTKDRINTDNGDRAILTFKGDKSFTLIEEAATVSEEFEIIPVYGDPLMINDTIGALSANSLSWSSNNITYYLTGKDLTTEEMINIATSLGTQSTVVTNSEK